MAKKMSWTDPGKGYTYPDLIWVPMGFNNDVSRRANKTDILAYSTVEQAAKVIKYALGLPGGEFVEPITSVSYTPTPEEFSTMALTDYPGANYFERTAAACYALAESSEQNRWKDEDDEMRPFFYTAQDVNIPLGPSQSSKKTKKKGKVTR